MAEAIGFAILSAVGTTAATATTASVIGSIAIGAASIGGQLVLGALNQPKPRNDNQQSVLNQAMGPRVVAYGRTMVGGSRFFFDTRNGALFQGIVLSARRIDGVEGYWIGDKKVVTTLGENGGRSKTFPQIDVVDFRPHLGTDDQAVDQFLFDNYKPSFWTADHQLKGVAYVVVTFFPVKKEEQQLVYPQSYATPLRFTIRGARVWNPDDSNQDPGDNETWLFSEDPALCVLDYLRHRDGMRFPLSRMDVPSFQALSDTCGETLTRRDGTTEPRYRLGGTYALTEAPKDVLARMCATCDTRLVRGPTGLIGVRGGKYSPPTVHVVTKNIVTASLTQGNDKLDAYNRLKVSYSDPDNFYQPTELQARDDILSQQRVGVVDQTLDLVMVGSWTQAARLAKIKFAKDNPAWKGTLGTDLSALDAMGEDTIDVTFDPLQDPSVGPIVDISCDVTAFSIRPDLTGCDLGIVSMSPAVYSWDPAVEEPPRPALPNILAPINVVETPSGVNVSPSRRSVGDGNTAVWGVLAWNASTRTDVSPQAQYRLTSGTDADWQPMNVRADLISAEAGPLTDGESYSFRVRFMAGSAPSNWSNVVTLLARADDTAPGPPTSFVTNGGAGQYRYAFTAPNSPNFGSVVSYLGTSTDFESASVVRTFNGAASQSFDMVETGVTPGSYRLWVRARNRSGYGDSSSTSGPMTVVVT